MNIYIKELAYKFIIIHQTKEYTNMIATVNPRLPDTILRVSDSV